MQESFLLLMVNQIGDMTITRVALILLNGIVSSNPIVRRLAIDGKVLILASVWVKSKIRALWKMLYGY